MKSIGDISVNVQQLLTQCNATRGAISVILFAYLALPPSLVWALPHGEAVSSGNATFERSGNQLLIKQGSDKLITQWSDFSIASGELTRFEQPTANSAALNRVVGGSRSIIDGRLEANGKVILINPAGVTVGPTGVVNVNRFTVSTQDVSDAEFLGGGELLYQGVSQASIENHGLIHAAGGDAIIIAKHLVNQGSIEAPNGTVALAAATEVLVRPVGETRITIRPGSEKGATVTQGVTGRVQAAAAEVRAAGNPYALAINLDGLIATQGTATTRGKVAVSGGNTQLAATGRIKSRSAAGGGGEVTITHSKLEDPKGKIEIAGTVDAAGETGEGGLVAFRASLITLQAGSLVDASSATGKGGRITVGGEFQGGLDPTNNADTVVVEAGALLQANAGTNGNGGTIIVWSDRNTFFYGNLEARGGTASGNGGFAEVSGKEYLSFSGGADLGAGNGARGTVLLDPSDVTLTSGAVTPIVPTSPETYDPAGASSTISWADLNSISAANVTISTAGGVGGLGDITVSGSGVWAGTGTLSFVANRDIVFLPTVAVTASATTGSFDFQAGRHFTMTGASVATYSQNNANGSGSISVQSGANGGSGDLTITGSSLIATGNQPGATSGDLFLEAHNGNILITNNATYANTLVMAGGNRTPSFTPLTNRSGDLTLRAREGSITINQVEDVTSDLTLTAAQYNALLGGGTPPTFFAVSSKGGNVTLDTDSSNTNFALNRDITINLLRGQVSRNTGTNDLNTTVSIQSGRDLLIDGDTTEGKSFVGSTLSRGTLDIDVARNLTMTDSGSIYVGGAGSVSHAVNIASTSLVDIRVGGNLTLSGGTYNGFSSGSPNTITSGSRIDGGNYPGGAVLLLNVGGSFAMSAASAIARFSYNEINVAENITLNDSAVIFGLGIEGVDPSLVNNYTNGLLHSLPGYASAVSGIYLTAQGLTTPGNITLTGQTRVDNSGSGDIRFSARTNITSTGTSAGFINTIRVHNASTVGDNSGDVQLIAAEGAILLTNSLVAAATSGSSNSIAGGDVEIQAPGNITLTQTTLLTQADDSGAAMNPTISLTSLNGDVIFNGGTNTVTLIPNIGGSATPAQIDLMQGTFRVWAENGEIRQSDGSQLTLNVHNSEMLAESLTFLGRQTFTIRQGNARFESTVGDIVFGSTPFGAATSILQLSGLGTSSTGLVMVSARDILLQPTTGGLLSIQSTAPATRPSPITLTAARHLTLGVLNSTSRTEITSTGGNIALNANAGHVTLNSSSAGVPVIRTTTGSSISLYGRDGIDFVPLAANVNPSGSAFTVTSSNGGAISLLTDFGNINLGKVTTDSGLITITAGNPLVGGAFGSILDAFGARTMTAATHANVTSTSGAVVLYAATTIGQGPGGIILPINTTREIKFNLASPASVSATSLGSAADEGIYLSAFNDLLIGVPSSTSISAQGDVILKSIGNVYVNGNVVSNGAGKMIGIRSNNANTRNADFATPSTSGDIILAGSLATTNGAIFLETGNPFLAGAVAALAASNNDIQYVSTSSESLRAGSGAIYMRANRDLEVGRLETTSGNLTLLAGAATGFHATTGLVNLDGDGLPSITAGKGQILDVFQRELRDTNTAASGNIVTTAPINNVTTVTLVGGKSVGLIANGQDIDLALTDGTLLRVYGKGTDSDIVTSGDGVFLSFLGNFVTNDASARIRSGSNLSISVTGDLTVSAAGVLTTANNGNIWLTAYGTATPTAGRLIVNASVTAHGDGNINIFALRSALINSAVTTTSGDISIIGAGRAVGAGEYGVEITSLATVTTGSAGGQVGTLHLASLGSADATGASIVTHPTNGRILVGDVEIYGQASATVPASGGTYYVGVSYGAEVVYDTDPLSADGTVTGVAGSTATTGQSSVLASATASGGITYSIDNIGQITIQTSTGTLVSLDEVTVASVTINGATTTVTGAGSSQATTSTGLASQTSTLDDGTSTFGANYAFSLSAAGNATITNGGGQMTLANTNGVLTVGAVTTSGAGTSASLTTTAGATSTITTTSTGNIGSAAYAGDGSNATFVPNTSVFNAGTSGTVTATGAGLSAVITDGSGSTTVTTSSGFTASLIAGSAMDLTTAATNATVVVDTTVAPLSYATFTNAGTTVFADNADVVFGTTASSVGLAGLNATANMGSVTAISSSAGSTPTVTINLASALTHSDLNNIAAAGGTADLVTVTLNNGTGVNGSGGNPTTYTAGTTAGNFSISAGLVLEFTSAGIETTTPGVVSYASSVYTDSTLANSTITNSNVSVVSATAGFATTGTGLSSTVGGGITRLDVSASGGIMVDAAGGPVTLQTSNTPDFNDSNYWVETGAGTGVYTYTGPLATTLVLTGGTLIQHVGSTGSNLQVRLAAGGAGNVDAAAQGAVLTYTVASGGSTTGSFAISSLSIAGSQTIGTVNVQRDMNITGATVTATNGSARIHNFDSAVVAAGGLAYNSVALNGGDYTMSSATVNQFANIGLTTTSATSISSSQFISTNGLSAANVSGGSTTFNGSIVTGANNTLGMLAGAGGMTVTPGGSLVNINGINNFNSTNPLVGSSLRIAEGATVQTQGGNLYASGYNHVELGRVDARGAALTGGNVFVEASTGSVISLNPTPGFANVIGNSATINGGAGLPNYGVAATSGAIGGTGTGAIKLDVTSLNFNAGSGGAFFRSDEARSLPGAGSSLGQVAILNDHNLSVEETDRITFNALTGINLSTRFWTPFLDAATQVGIDAGTQTVFLRSTDGNGGGNIVSNENGRVTGGNIYLDAEAAIGESPADRLLTNGTDLWFRAANGSAFLSELNASEIAGTALATGAEIDIVTESAGNLTTSTEGGPAINHPIDGANQPAISGLRADENVTVATHSGRLIVNQEIVSDNGNVDLTANFFDAVGDFGVLLNADVLATTAGARVRVLANRGDIWRTAGVIRAGDVQIRTNAEGAIGSTNGTESAVFTEAPRVSFHSVESASIHNAGQPSTVIGGQAEGFAHFVNVDGLLTVQQHTNFIGTILATALDETRAGVVTAGGDIVLINQAGNVQLNDVTSAGAGANHASIWAQTGSIFSNNAITSQVTGNEVTLVSGAAAVDTIGTAASRIFTNATDLMVDSGSHVFLNEVDGTRLAGITANNGTADVLAGGTIRVANLDADFNIGLLVYNPAAYYGIHAHGSGDVTLDANGATSDVAFAATARSGTGMITILADRNLTDEIATDLTDGLNSNSLLLNIVTGGNVVLNAGVNIGGKGEGTLDVAAGGTIQATSGGPAVGDGTYLSVLGDVVIGGNTTITSGRNIDVTTYSRSASAGGLGAQFGDLTVATAMVSGNAGYTRLNASRNLTVNAAIHRAALGDVILQTRTGDIDSNGTAVITAESLILESFRHAGLTNALNTAVMNLTFRLGGDLFLVETDGFNVSGQATNVNLTTISGDLRVNELTDYQAWALAAATDDVNDSVNPLNFAFTGLQSGIRANLASGGILLTATAGSILDAATAENNNLTAFFAVLNAATDIGRDPMFDPDDLNTELALLAANTTTGSVNIWELNGVFVGNSSIANDFRINAGGFIGQVTGTTIAVTDEVELDTERDTTLGNARVRTTGAVTLDDSRVRGNYDVETTGGTTLDGNLLVAGNFDVGNGGVVLASGASVVGGAFTATGGFSQTGGTLMAYGGSNVVSAGISSGSGNLSVMGGQTLVIEAFGSSPDFNLSVILDALGTQLGVYETSLNAGAAFDTILVNLKGTSLQLTGNNLPALDAIRWDGPSNQMARLLVRTGPVDTGSVSSITADYNLVQSAAVNVGGRTLIINGAVGGNVDATPFVPTATPTAPLVAVNPNFNSFVNLSDAANVFGTLRAYNTATTVIREAGNLDLGQTFVNGNLDVQSVAGDVNIGVNGETVQIGGTARIVAVGSGADVNFVGDTTFQGNAIAAAGMDLTNTATITANNNLTLIVDENAGSAAGGGWFRNTGTIISNDLQRDLAIYAAGGPRPVTGYTGATGNQVIWGTIMAGGVDVVAEMQSWTAGIYGGSNLNHKYATSYQTGGAYHGALAALLDGFGTDYDPDDGVFGSPVIWYKEILSAQFNRPSIQSLDAFFFDREQDQIETTQIGDYSEYERHPGEFEEDFLRQKSFGVFYQREAFRRAARNWAPDPTNILNGHFTDQRYFLQGKSLMRAYRTDRFHSEFVR